MHLPVTYTISVLPYDGRPGRFRWTVSEEGKERDRSFHNFATKREAHADAKAFVDKLTVIWERPASGNGR